jgi:hypothetical protein
MEKQQLEKEMWEMNYTIGAIEQAEGVLEEINEELEESDDLESILDDFGIYHARVRS